ncbi:MAG: hypothetical protein ACRDHW_06345 [Ktedonobacteraceae bacterium]
MKKLQTLLLFICRTIIGCIFWLSIRVGASLTISGVTYDRGLPRTYLGMTHKRDTDPFLLLPTIGFHRGWRALAGDFHFALRADGFTRGFLARMIARPAWFARLLRPLSVGPALRWLGTYPIEGLIRPAEEWVREVLQTAGDMPAETILAPAFLRDFAQATALSLVEVNQLALSHLLAWRYQHALRDFYGPEILRGPRRRQIERQVIERIHTHQADISGCLWQDGTFLGSPEGQLSPDGRVSPMYAGFRRLIRAVPPDLRVVPISLIYDFMTSGRLRIFVDFAPTLEYAGKLPLTELDAHLRHAWLLHAHFTCTQLASGFLMARQQAHVPEFTLNDFTHAVYQQACELAAAGRHVDPLLLQPATVTRRTRQYLTYAERHGLVQRHTAQHWQLTLHERTMQVGPREVAYEKEPLLYAYNELQDLLSVSALPYEVRG